MIRWEFKKLGSVWTLLKVEYSDSHSVNILMERHRNESEKNIALDRVMDVLVHKLFLEKIFGTHTTREMLDI